jgi:hypothetical protein
MATELLKFTKQPLYMDSNIWIRGRLIPQATINKMTSSRSSERDEYGKFKKKVN